MKSTLRVLFLIAEADPLIKVGGLGDVGGSLPPALANLSGRGVPKLDVRLAIPHYSLIRHQEGRPLVNFRLPYPAGEARVDVRFVEIDGSPIYLIGGDFILPEAPVYSNDSYADGLKFTFFSLAALELARRLDWAPHILHANDWHTSPAVYALWRMRDVDPFFHDTAALLGLHNLPYMGAGAGPALEMFGLPPAHQSGLPWWACDMPLPLGLYAADHIVAVSPTYAAEILTPDHGLGLEDYLLSRRGAISGILNGLDTRRWDPATDPYLAANYSTANQEARLANKITLQAEFGLDQDPNLPLLAMIGRMEYQKGVDLIPEALRLLAVTPGYSSLPWQFITLGMGDPLLEDDIRRLGDEFPTRVRLAARFDVPLSHRIYAGADILLLPSRYEPCGLAQMIAMRYGCVPVARATGGLRDTIREYGESPTSTGFLFSETAAEYLAAALGRALRVYADRQAWGALQSRGMHSDFSWTRSARQYLDLYRTLLDRRQAIKSKTVGS
jgi:starch synthase